MKILFFGDIFGKPGREALKIVLPEWKTEHQPDVIIANGENASHGSGLTPSAAKEILSCGVDVISGGNHFLKENREMDSMLNDRSLPILRPLNFLPGNAGRGSAYFKLKQSSSEKNSWLRIEQLDDPREADLAVLSAIGQVHMKSFFDSPFNSVENAVSKIKTQNKNIIIVVDFHADAASEKKAMGWFLDGKVSAVIGTHTHTPTADEEILPKGTAYISDIGMVGPHNSIIGQDIQTNLQRFILQKPLKVEVAPAPPYEINAVFIEIDNNNQKALEIRRLRKIFD